MQALFATLRTDEWRLFAWGDGSQAAVSIVGETVHYMRPEAFALVAQCDGATNFLSLAFLPEHRLFLGQMADLGIVALSADRRDSPLVITVKRSAAPRIAGIHWHITGRCNLRCRHCYMQAKDGRFGELPLPEVQRLIGEFKKANIQHVALSGGEPFLREDMNDIISCLAEHEIRISKIYSNGLLVTNAHLLHLKELGLRPTFQISFDGCNGCHDSMRGVTGIEPSTLAAIGTIKATGFPVEAATSIDRTNIHSLLPTYEILKKLQVNAWIICAPFPIGAWTTASTAISLGEQRDGLLPLFKLWLNDGKPFILNLGGFSKDIPLHSSEPAAESEHKTGANLLETTRYACGGCRELPNLLPDGTLIPCAGYIDMPSLEAFPNLLKTELEQAWQDKHMRQIMDITMDELLDIHKGCRVCPHLEDCGIGCRCAAFVFGGDVKAIDPVTCQIFKGGHHDVFLAASK